MSEAEVRVSEASSSFLRLQCATWLKAAEKEQTPHNFTPHFVTTLLPL